MQVARFLLACIGDVGCQFWSQIDSEFLDDGLAFGIENRKTQFSGLYRWEADDTTVTDGSQTITVLNERILQLFPLAVDKCLE